MEVLSIQKIFSDTVRWEKVGREVKLTISRFFCENQDLTLYFRSAGVKYYMHDNGCAAKVLKSRCQDKYKWMMGRICDRSERNGDVVWGAASSLEDMSHYLQLLIMIANGDLVYKYMREPLYLDSVMKHFDTLVFDDDTDMDKLICMLTEKIMFSQEENQICIFLPMSYPGNSAKIRYDIVTRTDGTICINDSKRDEIVCYAMKGYALERAKESGTGIDGFDFFLEPIVERFGGYSENNELCLKVDDEKQFPEGLCRFVNVSMLCALCGYTIGKHRRYPGQMLGAIVGDVMGAVEEFSVAETIDLDLLETKGRFTENSIMTIAVGGACAASFSDMEDSVKGNLVWKMQELGSQYMSIGYDDNFVKWLQDGEYPDAGCIGNGAAKRVSVIAWDMKTKEDVERVAKWNAQMTHRNEEDVKGAQALAMAVFLAKEGAGKAEIKAYIEEHYYAMNFTLDEIKEKYHYDGTCANSVPQAIQCFLEADNYVEAVCNAISLDDHSQTLASMAGAIAEACYEIPEEIRNTVLNMMDREIRSYYLEYMYYI